MLDVTKSLRRCLPEFPCVLRSIVAGLPPCFAFVSFVKEISSPGQRNLHLCREVPVAIPQSTYLQGVRFFNAYCFSILSGEGVQHKWCDPQVYSVLDERVDVIRAVLPLKQVVKR